MKKRNLKKLVLHRETLTELNGPDLGLIRGGTGTGLQNSCPEFCVFSGRRTCGTCQLTCTTNLC